MNKNTKEIESYRSLRTRIQLGHPEDKLISVISNDQGDGKTEIVYKLAESFAKAGKKVLMIDGNLRYPDLSLKLRQEGHKGLDSLLRSKGDLVNSLIQCDHDKLFILPTQESSHDSTELLQSKFIFNIIEEVRKQFDYILIDTLSLNEGMDGLILSKISDGAIYLTVGNKTKSKMVEEYRTMLEEANIKLLGAIWKH